MLDETILTLLQYLLNLMNIVSTLIRGLIILT